jgi:hypothetical protein
MTMSTTITAINVSRPRVLAAAVAIALLALVSIGAARASAVPFEITSFKGGVFSQDGPGAEETQAGARPFRGTANFQLNRVAGPISILPIGSLRDTFTQLPPGLVGNPRALPTCPSNINVVSNCPLASQVGFALVDISLPIISPYHLIYNMETQPGTPALFRFDAEGAPILLSARLRTGGDYGVEIVSRNAPQTIATLGVEVTLWGVPADPAHDFERGGNGKGPCVDPAVFCSNPSTAPLKPFISLPTSCSGPVETQITISTWEGESDAKSFTSPGGEGCNALDFSPTLKARPTTNVADSPSGLDVNLHIPQNEACDPGPPVNCGLAEAHLRDTVVKLPEGMTVNPSSANGLGACAPAQIGLTSAPGVTPITMTADAAACPDAAKLGTVSVDTPVLDHPVQGAAYIATPYDNPFGSLLALYIALDDPKTGIVVKLAGKVSLDPVSGQLTATFDENPQLPFEDFTLHFFGGAGGSLRTPSICGNYETTSSFTPWSAPDSGPPDTPADTWAIEQGPGGSCANDVRQLPNSPSFDAGTASSVAGAKSAMVINLKREDGSQQFKSLTVTPPQGLVGKLAGIPYCPQSALDEAAAKSGRAEEASPSCPAASYVGSSTAAAGAGPAPYYAAGRAYLTGPYKGAPLSIAIVTPATAGPFDLGTIVVRTAVYVDRRTAQITAVSDEIPQILQGIALDVRSVQVKMDRPDFTINPTSCDPMGFGGSLLSTQGSSAALLSRFQVAECGRLAFKPRMRLSLKGGIRRNGYPALTAVLTMPEGGANLSGISVALPHSEFLAQEHIRTICTRVQFAADQCPAGSIYGNVTVNTPLLDYPLTGPVYLRSSDNPLPDLVPDLRGPASQPIKLESAGRTDSIRGGIRNTFDFVPDAPFTKLVLQMQGGKKGLLVNSRNICAKPYKATVKYSAHNGATLEAHPVLRAKCPKKASKRNRGATRHHRTG